MQEFIPFFMQHIALFIGLVFVMCLIIYEEYQGQSGGKAKLGPKALVQKMNHDNAVLLDIRSREQFQQSHIKGAINIAKQDIDANMAKLEKYKTKPVVIVCYTGRTAASLVPQLKKKGFEDLYVLQGGIEAWRRESLPTTKG